jgi:hypothetical protein
MNWENSYTKIVSGKRQKTKLPIQQGVLFKRILSAITNNLPVSGS